MILLSFVVLSLSLQPSDSRTLLNNRLHLHTNRRKHPTNYKRYFLEELEVPPLYPDTSHPAPCPSCEPVLHLKHLENPNAVCNDGSPAG